MREEQSAILKLMTLLVFFLLGTQLILPLFSKETEKVELKEIEDAIEVGTEYANKYGRLEVTPETSNGLITQLQYANFTSNITNNVDIAFRFDYPIDNGKVWIWRNCSHITYVNDYAMVEHNYTLYNISNYEILTETPLYVDFGDIPSTIYGSGTATYYNAFNEPLTKDFVVGYDTRTGGLGESHFFYESETNVGNHQEYLYYEDWDNLNSIFDHTVHNGKHYYYVTNIPVIKGKSYYVKWMYDVPLGSTGKWDLLAKLTEDSIEESLSSGRYIMLDPWWNSNYDYFKTIEIANGHATKPIVSGYTVNFTFDSSALVGAGKMQADGDDCRIVYQNTTELDRFNITGWNTASTTVEFKLQAQIPASSTNSTDYLMYYGNAAATNPPDNKSDVYLLFQDFEDTADEADPAGWTEYGDAGTFKVQADGLAHNGTKAYELTTGGGGGETRTYYSGAGSTWVNYSVEFWQTRPTDTSSYYTHEMYYVENADIQDYYMWGWGATDVVNAYRHNGGYTKTAGDFAGVHNVNEWHKFTAKIWEDDHRYYYDGVYKGSDLAESTHVAGHIGIRADTPAAGAYYYDDFKVRYYMRPEPTLSLGSEQTAGAGWSNSNPINSAPYPSNGATNIDINLAWLNITVNDLNCANQTMNITFYTNESGHSRVAQSTNTSVTNGTYRCLNTTWVDSYSTKYWWTVNTSDGHGGYDNDTYSFTTEAAPYNPSKYLRIEIESDYIEHDLVNFPVLVTVNSTVSAQCDGGLSIDFNNSDNTSTYNFEIENGTAGWDDTSNNYIWVNITRVSSSVDTVFFMTYNDSLQVTDRQDVEGTWNDGYFMVQHFSGSDSTAKNAFPDSTSNGNDATLIDANGNSSVVTGQVDDAVELSGVDDYFFISHRANQEIDGNATWEFIFRPYWVTAGSQGLATKRDAWNINSAWGTGWGYGAPGPQSDVTMETTDDGTSKVSNLWNRTNNIIQGEWRHLTYVFNRARGTDFSLHMNMTRLPIVTKNDEDADLFLGTSPILLGAINNASKVGFFNGTFDEFRLSNVERNTSWINATFNSINNSAFLTYGLPGGAWEQNTLGWFDFSSNLNYTQDSTGWFRFLNNFSEIFGYRCGQPEDWRVLAEHNVVQLDYVQTIVATPEMDGYVESVYAYLRYVEQAANVKAAIYDSSGNLLGESEEKLISSNTGQWYQFNFTGAKINVFDTNQYNVTVFGDCNAANPGTYLQVGIDTGVDKSLGYYPKGQSTAGGYPTFPDPLNCNYWYTGDKPSLIYAKIGDRNFTQEALGWFTFSHNQNYTKDSTGFFRFSNNYSYIFGWKSPVPRSSGAFGKLAYYDWFFDHFQSYNRTIASNATPLINGNVDYIKAYLKKDEGAGEEVKCGIYDTSGNLLGETEEKNVTDTTGQWYRFNFSSSVAVTAGTYYYLAAFGNTSENEETRKNYTWIGYNLFNPDMPSKRETHSDYPTFENPIAWDSTLTANYMIFAHLSEKEWTQDSKGFFLFDNNQNYTQNTLGWFRFLNNLNFSQNSRGFFTFNNNLNFTQDTLGFFTFNHNQNFTRDALGWFAFSHNLNYTQNDLGWFRFSNNLNYTRNTAGWFRFNSNLNYTQDSLGWFLFNNNQNYTRDTLGWFLFNNNLNYTRNTAGFFLFNNNMNYTRNNAGFFAFCNNMSFTKNDRGWFVLFNGSSTVCFSCVQIGNTIRCDGSCSANASYYRWSFDHPTLGRGNTTWSSDYNYTVASLEEGIVYIHLETKETATGIIGRATKSFNIGDTRDTIPPEECETKSECLDNGWYWWLRDNKCHDCEESDWWEEEKYITPDNYTFPGKIKIGQWEIPTWIFVIIAVIMIAIIWYSHGKNIKKKLYMLKEVEKDEKK